MSQAESFIKQKSNDDYVGSQKNVKLSKRYFKQTRFVVLIKLKANTKIKNCIIINLNTEQPLGNHLGYWMKNNYAISIDISMHKKLRIC